MQDLADRINTLRHTLHIEDKMKRIEVLEKALLDIDAWHDATKASQDSQDLHGLQEDVAAWQHVSDLIAAGTESDRVYIEGELKELEMRTLLSGPHDASAAILSIHAGTGGVDAQDWADILYKMYVRYAEKSGRTVSVIEYNSAEEAGLKSVTMRIVGLNAYGFLKGEAGVHRLVRLSPFNAKHLRQTSFALVEVIPEITKVDFVIPDTDVRVDVYRASGHGGQGVNTTDSAVRLTHVPTGLVVTCQNERSQLQNRETAMRILTSRIAVLMEKEHVAEMSALKPQVQGSWGNQIRSYVMQPYTLVKDHRTNSETADVAGVLGGDLDAFIKAELQLS